MKTAIWLVTSRATEEAKGDAFLAQLRVSMAWLNDSVRGGSVPRAPEYQPVVLNASWLLPIKGSHTLYEPIPADQKLGTVSPIW
ncbi:hypothetical protein [uncultured Stenotrophomonas sp.]|uniref:hypothetical protein n=1 Tax=uncultured Stenotrophomonas sp. TaxID=165438 RepID=UPI0025FDA714|nr:hypothetical protein [uncultured Stenotrophomonas sp.]